MNELPQRCIAWRLYAKSSFATAARVLPNRRGIYVYIYRKREACMHGAWWHAHMVTGGSTLCTFDSSARISTERSQSSLTWASSRSSQRFRFSIHLSKSIVIFAPPRLSLSLSLSSIDWKQCFLQDDTANLCKIRSRTTTNELKDREHGILRVKKDSAGQRPRADGPRTKQES